MKYISFILITLWSVWAIVTNGDLKPSDDCFLWLLSILSVLYSFMNLIALYADVRLKNRKQNLY